MDHNLSICEEVTPLFSWGRIPDVEISIHHPDGETLPEVGGNARPSSHYGINET